MTTPIEKLNDFRQRILKCKALRAEGKDEEADALAPSAEELREALIALRAHRGQAVETAAEKKKPAIDPMANLNDLFAKK